MMKYYKSIIYKDTYFRVNANKIWAISRCDLHKKEYSNWKKLDTTWCDKYLENVRPIKEKDIFMELL